MTGRCTRISEVCARQKAISQSAPFDRHHRREEPAMDEIKRQVGRAHRRLVFQQVLCVVGWSLFATLLIAAIGLAVPRIWVLAVDQQAWDWSWIGGGVGAGLLMAG